MNKILPLAFLLLINCGEQKPTATSQKENPKSEQKETLKSIAINSAGGQLGYVSSFILTRDSVVFRSDMTATKNNKIEIKKAIDHSESDQILKNINIEDFKKAIENESRQPVDGIDQTIILKIGEKQISKMNAHGNKTWEKILALQSKYVDQE